MKKRYDYLPEADISRITTLISLGKNEMRNQGRRRVRRGRILLLQFRYLSAAFWFFQLIAIVSMFVVVYYLRSRSLFNAELISLLAPMTSVFAVPEIFKDLTFRMTELEMSSMYRSAEVLTLRIFAVGSINFLSLLILSVLFSHTLSMSFAEVALKALLPVNILLLLSLYLLQFIRKAGRSSVLAITVLSSAVVYFLNVYADQLFSLSRSASISMTFVTSLLIIWKLKKRILFYKRKEDMLWNW